MNTDKQLGHQFAYDTYCFSSSHPNYLMSLKILGLNHSTAPVEIREQVIYNGDDVSRALTALVTLENVHEAVVLSTCARATCMGAVACAHLSVAWGQCAY